MRKTLEEKAKDFADVDWAEHEWRGVYCGFLAGYWEAVMYDFQDRMKAMISSNFSNNWISVEKALPNLFQEVIVAAPFEYENGLKSCHIGTARLLPDKHGASWSLNLENKWTLKVAHWMPMPEPPIQSDTK